MKFYNRQEELELLEKTRKLSLEKSMMTFVVGRRRIGKTSLVHKAFRKQKFLYFFIARKNETLLCNEFTEEIELVMKKRVLGEFRSFSKLFEYLLERSKGEAITLIIDEFQEFYQSNPSVYSEMQKLWDQYKMDQDHEIPKMNLVLCGSVYSLMKKIFENAKEPLFGRADEKIHLKPFSVEILKSIYMDHSGILDPEDFLAFYTLTGGVAKYVEIFVDKKCITLEAMLDEIFRPNSLLLEEGKNILIEEFGKDYLTYFSILSLIASGKTSRGEIESILEKDIGGYLNRLEKEYNIIQSIRPVFSKPGGKMVKYMIDDNFLAFWFRIIYKYRSAIEINNLEYVKQIVKRDYKTYSGIYLEKYYREVLSERKEYNIIGRYWDRKGENELDIVAVNQLENKALIAEVKRNKDKINIKELRTKASILDQKFSSYEIIYEGFTLDDVFSDKV